MCNVKNIVMPETQSVRTISYLRAPEIFYKCKLEIFSGNPKIFWAQCSHGLLDFPLLVLIGFNTKPCNFTLLILQELYLDILTRTTISVQLKLLLDIPKLVKTTMNVFTIFH